ncbi:MAG: type IV secretory system conjugative DNA transfer family protein [Alphaproteobacteria bacterium]
MVFQRAGEYADRDKAVSFLITWFAIALVVCIILFYIIQPVALFLTEGLSRQTLADALEYWRTHWRPNVWASGYSMWISSTLRTHSIGKIIVPFIPVIVGLGIFVGAVILNPNDFMLKTFGGGRMANYTDIKKMKLFNGFIIVLGRFKGKLLKMPETLSALVVAPPGTGKTVGVVIPTILESEGISVIVNDPKPELCYKTSGFRATQGPVFIINWGEEDVPEKGIFYPSWNPLSPTCLPPPGPPRDMYIDSMVAVIVEEPKGGTDPHWSKTGRNAMSGFLHFISSKCERARANDYFVNRLMEGSFDDEDAKVLATYYSDMPDMSARTALQALQDGTLSYENYAPVGTWEGLPQYWHGCEPCIAMILDWLNDAQMKIAADLKRRADEGDQMAGFADPMRDVLDYAVEECNRYHYSQRAMLELNQLSSTPDKERGSILSTALTGIGVFKNSAVRSRTRFSDFTFRDLRGMRDPVTGEMKPVTVYLSVNQVDARALSVITGIFIELMSSFLIANPPNFTGSDGQKTGPFPVLFALDEFPQMPKLAAVKDGPAVGRGQKVSYLLIGQDLGQISGQYGKDDLETIITTTAAKVILAQNNEQTAQRFEKMIGSKTIQTQSVSKQEAFGFNPKLSASVSTSLQSSSVVGASEMMSLDMMKQYVIFQGFLNRPILADAPRWYLDKSMKKKCSLPSAPYVPYWIVAQRENTQLDALSSALNEEIVELAS